MGLPVVLFVISLLALIGAYISQYVFGLEPCVLCLYQRIPYFLVILFSILAFFTDRKISVFFTAVCGMLLVIDGGVAFYHVGVENGLFVMDTACNDGAGVASTFEEMRAQILGKPNVPCDKPQFELLGISMAGFNFMYATFFGLYTLTVCFKAFKMLRLNIK